MCFEELSYLVLKISLFFYSIEEKMLMMFSFQSAFPAVTYLDRFKSVLDNRVLSRHSVLSSWSDKLVLASF